MLLAGRANVKNAVMMAAIPELKTAACVRPGFERHHLVLQNFGVGMRDARVNQIRAFALLGWSPAAGDVERALGGFRTGEYVSGAAKYRGPRRPER